MMGNGKKFSGFVFWFMGSGQGILSGISLFFGGFVFVWVLRNRWKMKYICFVFEEIRRELFDISIGFEMLFVLSLKSGRVKVLFFLQIPV